MKNILFIVTGLSPQVLTETLFYLCYKDKIKVDRIIIITTEEGKKRLNDFSDNSNRKYLQIEKVIEELCGKYQFSIPKFERENDLITLSDEDFKVDDINTSENNLKLTNAIVNLLRELTNDKDTAVFCSVAGGRKTMSISMALGLSLFGRNQDSLSHVLASRDFEQTGKYYPENEDDISKIVLYKIPLLKLRKFLSLELEEGDYSEFIKKSATLFITDEIKKEQYGIFGDSDNMKEINSLIDRYKDKDAPVLIKGQTGSGKQLIAEAIHNFGSRKGKKFITINCSSYSTKENLRSELFGHEKGSFTGADKEKKGILELYEGGTVFLDEINSLDKELQGSLLRAVEYNKIQRYGGDRELDIDVRFLFASNQDLREESNNGNFREDLFQRISGRVISILPLKERKADILILTKYFIEQACKKYAKNVDSISEEVNDFLLNYDYPGNVRELLLIIDVAVDNCITNTLVISDFNKEITEATRKKLRSRNSTNEFNKSDNILNLDNTIRQYTIYVLKMSNGNKTQTARKMGVDPDTVRNYIKKYNIAEAEYHI